MPLHVPLSRKFDSQIQSVSGRWTLADAIRQFRGYGMEVATIIDLTKSHNYYDVGRELEELNYPQIRYYKIECRGRGESPKPSEVNEAVWHIYMHQMDPDTRDKYILLHCTHGYNRTGFVAVAALMRLRRDRGMSVRRALQRFAGSRPPGIYKDHYINDLFKYYHETRRVGTRAWNRNLDVRFLTPAVPAWKGNDDAEDAADAANEEGGAANEEGKAPAEAPAAPVINHEDIWSIGEKVCNDEASFVKQQVCNLLSFDGGSGRGQMRFPGMQPVSLALERLPDLMNNRRAGAVWGYWATWKADGTRYMVLILQHGTYIMDRSFNVVRCEMRFQCGTKRPPPGAKLHYPVGKPHDLTLLDGEMVLDHDPDGKVPPRLRYLIYDCCMINAIPLVAKPWKERYRGIESDIINPRLAEREYIEKWRGRTWDPQRAEYLAPPLNYDYNAEPFSVRRKPFWTVGQIDKVFERFHDPSKIGHESDGVILQGASYGGGGGG
ncbi:mRNA-capping enzyme [Tetrabaena socialis]|uniref:mRNA-capping enzyme n=1 Tax=Tetrabaena socialis TaxID=47790 RepID=A0A2J8A6D8_9CHLO|nr:mRNA-capping enzyme [Tetrabaena socialis]|eukprot:PNH08065.1 mRNA-capping enzyme [Tetrabaena socialis]